MESLLNANAGHKSWENTLKRSSGMQGMRKIMEKWEDLMCDHFSPGVILWFLFLNAGGKPFRRMWSTTLQYFPLLPGASAECRAVFGGTEIWGALTASSIHPHIPAVPPEGPHLLAAPRIHHSIETAFASLGACKSGAFQEFLEGATACGLSNPHSPC